MPLNFRERNSVPYSKTSGKLFKIFKNTLDSLDTLDTLDTLDSLDSPDTLDCKFENFTMTFSFYIYFHQYIAYIVKKNEKTICTDLHYSYPPP